MIFFSPFNQMSIELNRMFVKVRVAHRKASILSKHTNKPHKMYHVSLSPLRTIIIFRASWKKSPQTTRSTIPINHFYCFPFACSHFRGSDLCEYYSIGSWFSAYLSWGSHVRNAIEIHKHRTKALVLHTKRCRPQTMHGKSGIDHHRWIHYDAIQQSNPHVHSFQ